MGFTRIGFCSTTTGWYNVDEIEITECYPKDTFYIGWCCELQHPDDTFHIAIRYRGIGKNAPSVFPDWSAWKKVSIKGGAACNEHPNSYYGDYWYAVDIAKFGLKGLLTSSSSGSWTIQNRKYDYIEFQIGIGMTLAAPAEWNNNQTEVPMEYGESSLNYVPYYKATALLKGSLNQIQVVTNHPEGWRKDDRWGFDLIRTPSGSNLLDRNKACWGIVDAKGDIWIDKSYLRSELEAGRSYILNVRIVRAWKGIGETDYTLVSTVPYDDSPQCNTPTVSVVSATSDAVILNIGDSGDKNHPIEKVRVALQGSNYSCDVSEGALGQHTLAAQPFGRNVYEVTGWNETYGTSKTVTASATVSQFGNYTNITSGDGSYNLRLEYNPSFSIKVQPEGETIKFAGRSNPTRFLGNGTETKVELSGVLLNNDANDWLALSKSGELVIIRFPDGKRCQCSIDEFNTDWEQRQIKNISFSGTEVN